MAPASDIAGIDGRCQCWGGINNDDGTATIVTRRTSEEAEKLILPWNDFISTYVLRNPK
jgi:hypothetical protein